MKIYRLNKIKLPKERARVITPEIWKMAAQKAMARSEAGSNIKTKSMFISVLWLLASVLIIGVITLSYNYFLGEFASQGQIILYLLACIVLYVLQRKNII